MRKTKKRRSRSTRPALAPLDTLRRYPVNEASNYLAQCPAKTWRQIADGIIPVIRDEGRTYVSGQTIAERSRPPKQEAAAMSG